MALLVDHGGKGVLVVADFAVLPLDLLAERLLVPKLRVEKLDISFSLGQAYILEDEKVVAAVSLCDLERYRLTILCRAVSD